MQIEKVYARPTHVLSGFWAKFFAAWPRADVDIAVDVR